MDGWKKNGPGFPGLFLFWGKHFLSHEPLVKMAFSNYTFDYSAHSVAFAYR